MPGMPQEDEDVEDRTEDADEAGEASDKGAEDQRNASATDELRAQNEWLRKRVDDMMEAQRAASVSRQAPPLKQVEPDYRALAEQWGVPESAVRSLLAAAGAMAAPKLDELSRKIDAPRPMTEEEFLSDIRLKSGRTDISDGEIVGVAYTERKAAGASLTDRELATRVAFRLKVSDAGRDQRVDQRGTGQGGVSRGSGVPSTPKPKASTTPAKNWCQQITELQKKHRIY